MITVKMLLPLCRDENKFILYFHSVHFLQDVGEDVSLGLIVDHRGEHVGQHLLQLIVDHRGEHVGCGFVEFASVNEAEEALEKNNNREFCLDVAEIAPYPLPPKYKLAEKLWSKVQNLLTVEEEEETKPNLEKLESPMMGGCCGKKIIFSYDD